MNQRMKSLVRDGLAMTIVAVLASALGSQIPSLYNTWRDRERGGDFSRHVSGLPHAITLYGTTTCQYCQAARSYLQQSGISFNDSLVDQSTSARERFALLKESGVPVLVTKDRLIVGFEEDQYKKFFAAANR